jgi:hypothetical protein
VADHLGWTVELRGNKLLVEKSYGYRLHTRILSIVVLKKQKSLHDAWAKEG